MSGGGCFPCTGIAEERDERPDWIEVWERLWVYGKVDWRNGFAGERDYLGASVAQIVAFELGFLALVRLVATPTFPVERRRFRRIYRECKGHEFRC